MSERKKKKPADAAAGGEGAAAGQAPYVVGIDLGTTNCAVSYVDTELEEGEEGAGEIQVLPIPQLVSAGTIDEEGQLLLPSFIYLPGEHEVAEEAVRVPFAEDEDAVIGVFAREQGARVPDRLISSSKSWLCHPGVDRRGPILPWGSDPAEVPKLSPLEAQTRLLRTLRAAWDHAMAEDPAWRLAAQEVYLTVPASFDPTARELTVEAARAAGLEVALLEEPQAAFYAWLDGTGEAWREQLTVGDLVLVVDVGGGTTDLSLISVREEEGNLTLERVAVGEHLLLGGDNMDLALAHVAAARLREEKGKELDAWQSMALWQACRAAKEGMLANPKRESAPVTVLGRGSKLIGRSLKTELRRDDLERAVVQGFFPACRRDELPTRRRVSGLAEIGLPFAPDPAITKHIAAFLSRQERAGGGAPGGADGEDGADGFAYPTAVLFNGGVFKGAPVREAVLAALNAWLAEAGRAPVKVLTGEDLDLAVARGATAYGLVRRGRGVRIRGGTARSYYLGIESALPAVPGMPAPLKALCVAPFGMEVGTSAEVAGRELSLLVGEPAEFRFLGSTVRRDDAPGALLDRWDPGELEELTPLEVTLPAGEGEEPGGAVPVTLRSNVTEVGTLEVHCVARDGRTFRLEWNVREQEGA